VIPFVTHDVKPAECLETHLPLHYNLHVSNARAFLVLLLALGLTGCKKDKVTPDDPGMNGALERAGSSGSGGSGGEASDGSPLPGIDIAKLDADKQTVYYKLLSSLSSPCGKAHSLRTSFLTDQSCKRAPYAVRYLVALLEDDVPETKTRELWEAKYHPSTETYKFDLSKEPHIGSEDAPIRIVEFYDYGCPHCAEFRPMLESVMDHEKGKMVVYFMHYTLGNFQGSKEAAQAALAAHAQHKFKEMHDMLFEHQRERSHDDIFGFAKTLGLDMAKFEADYNAQAAHVDAQRAQGQNAAVSSTPTLYFNDRKYEGPMSIRYLEMWIDEELAVNR
jgi:protein-disulfide isomerase